MLEAERRITFCYFLSLTVDKYSIDARKNRFLFFFKSKDRSDGEGYEKKMPPLESRRNGFSKGEFFWKIRILIGCKKSSKKGKNSTFRKRISFINCGYSSGNLPTVLILVPMESQFNVQSWTKKNATLVVIPTHIIVEKWNWYHSSWKSVLFKAR